MIIFKAFFLKYLLMPLIAFVMVGVMYFVQKKNAAANNKRLIVYILLAAIILALPGFAGLAGNTFSPYWYLFSQIVYLALGVLHVHLLSLYFKNDKNKKAFTIFFESLLTLICMLVGAYLFTLIFNWLSPFQGYAWMSATTILTFGMPLIFYYTYLQFMAIPPDIYKVWFYNADLNAVEFNGLDFNKLMVLNVEFTKRLQDAQRFSVKAKSPATISLGDWFYRFIEDYNVKYPQAQIEVKNGDGAAHAWIFYAKKSFFHRRRYLDFAKTIEENKVSENITIICKRVEQQEVEKVVNAKNNFS